MFFVEPEYNTVKVLRKDRDNYREAVLKYEAFSEKLDKKVQEKRSINTSDTERLNEFIPNEVDSTQLLVKLEKMAKNRNMLFGNVKADDNASKDLLTRSGDGDKRGGERDEKLVSSDISFSVIGTYSQFKDFLTDLESSLTLFEIIKIDLAEAGETQFQQYTLEVRTYALTSE